MLIAIIVLLSLILFNEILLVLIMLSIYGKCNDLIGYIESSKAAAKDFAKGLIDGLKKS